RAYTQFPYHLAAVGIERVEHPIFRSGQQQGGAICKSGQRRGRAEVSISFTLGVDRRALRSAGIDPLLATHHVDVLTAHLFRRERGYPALLSCLHVECDDGIRFVDTRLSELIARGHIDHTPLIISRYA